MPRPRHTRRVSNVPDVTYFKPAGVPMSRLQVIVLTVEEFEALRLKDFLERNQKDAAEEMDISQPTFHRLVKVARQKIAEAIVRGKSIKIEGGNYHVDENKQSGFGYGGGRRRMGEGRKFRGRNRKNI